MTIPTPPLGEGTPPRRSRRPKGRGGVMRMWRPLTVAFVLAVAVVRAGRDGGQREAAGVRGHLRYHVPVGQDAAALLAAVRHEDFSATVEVAGGAEDIVVACIPERDRESVRRVLAGAPVDMAGHGFDPSPVAFVGE